MKRSILLLVTLLIFNAPNVTAQCAMCRTQLANNVSNGTPGIAAGINMGILYLLVMPYLAIFIIGYFWYKSSKRNGTQLNKRFA